MDEFYSIYQDRVFEYLRDGRERPDVTYVAAKDWFARAVAQEFELSAQKFHCCIKLSIRRLEQARALWVDDIQRIRFDPEVGEQEQVPDHFKQAGHLAYWLRRRVVAEQIYEDPESRISSAQKTFVLYGNEISAFRLGFHLCLGFETQHLSLEDRKIAFQEMALEPAFLVEIGKLLLHKNVSPQALYLIYRSLFYKLLPTPSGIRNPIQFSSEANVIAFRPKKPQR